jgi:hypothetical protein
VRTLKLEWIEEDDDGLDPRWLELSYAERIRRAEELKERGLDLMDAMNGTCTPRRMDRSANRFVPREPEA